MVQPWHVGQLSVATCGWWILRSNMPGNLWNYGNEGGLKHYVVMCKDDVEVRASPTYADDARVGHFLHPGQVVAIDDRRMVQGSWFLHLADGRGWVFETKERLLVMTEARDFERSLWHYSIVCEDDVETRIAPTLGRRPNRRSPHLWRLRSCG